MATIHSLSFQDNIFTWMEIATEKGMVNIKRAVSDTLPVSISYPQIMDAGAVEELSGFLQRFRQNHPFEAENIRISLPSRLAIIHKVVTDRDLAEENQRELVLQEMAEILDAPPADYSIFLPAYSQSGESYQTLLAVAVPRTLLSFFARSFQAAGLPADVITPACFPVDELFRWLYPNDGNALLVGCQKMGADVTIAGRQNFQQYFFKPFSIDRLSISELSNEEIISFLQSLLEEVKHPPVLAEPLFTIDQVFFYGNYFNPEWLAELESSGSLTSQIFRVSDNEAMRFTSETEEFNNNQSFRFIEPVANIFS
ncbi:MAG: hypothetical protein WAN36_03030 [Calditrichia bacterium]